MRYCTLSILHMCCILSIPHKRCTLSITRIFLEQTPVYAAMRLVFAGEVREESAHLRAYISFLRLSGLFFDAIGVSPASVLLLDRFYSRASAYAPYNNDLLA